MEECLSGLRDDICQPYLDDNLVHSKTFEDHIQHIRTVLQRYQQHGAKLSAKKCEMFRKKVRFLGRMVSEDGYSMDPAEIAPVQALKEKKPTTVGELRKMLGFLSYYRAYVQNFSRLAKPLYDLLSLPQAGKQWTETQKLKDKKKKKREMRKQGQLPSRAPITWTSTHQQVLEQLVDLLSNPPMLVYPDVSISRSCYTVMPHRKGSELYYTSDKKEN